MSPFLMSVSSMSEDGWTQCIVSLFLCYAAWPEKGRCPLAGSTRRWVGITEVPTKPIGVLRCYIKWTLWALGVSTIHTPSSAKLVDPQCHDTGALQIMVYNSVCDAAMVSSLPLCSSLNMLSGHSWTTSTYISPDTHAIENSNGASARS